MSLGNTHYPFWNSGILLIEGEIPLSGQPRKYTKYLFPLVKELPIFEYK
jgi:hypothetical protein